jgi:hypothetical protein
VLASTGAADHLVPVPYGVEAHGTEVSHAHYFKALRVKGQTREEIT